MSSVARRPTDRASIYSLEISSGNPIELMRASYCRQVFPRHAHEYFTFGVMLSGVGTLGYRGADLLMQPGDVVVIPPGEVHTGGMARDTTALSYFAAHLPAELLAHAAADLGVRGGRVPDFSSGVIRDEIVGAELRRLADAMRGAPERIDIHSAGDTLTTAIALLVGRHAASVTSAHVTAALEPDLVRLTRETIEDCYADNTQTSLHALARRAGVTPPHLVRVFTQAIGLSPHRYVVQTRIRRARQFLATGIPSSLVAAMTGFVDQSHLTTQFRRYVGTTPASYQRGVGVGRPLPRPSPTAYGFPIIRIENDPGMTGA